MSTMDAVHSIITGACVLSFVYVLVWMLWEYCTRESTLYQVTMYIDAVEEDSGYLADMHCGNARADCVRFGAHHTGVFDSFIDAKQFADWRNKDAPYGQEYRYVVEPVTDEVYDEYLDNIQDEEQGE